MRYLSHTPEDVAQMMGAVGVTSLEELFARIPKNCCTLSQMDLPDPLGEWDLNKTMDKLAGSVAAAPEYQIYLGAGSYEHNIPASVGYLLGRSEFSTSYTPYQPELSQGTLQAIFEYQTLVSRLLGMEVANASMYDGASALAEAILMACRISRKKTVAISSGVHPLYRRVAATYLHPSGIALKELAVTPSGQTDLSGLDQMADLAAAVIQSPNFFGVMEDLEPAGDKVRDQKGLLVACFTEPFAFGVYKSPGSMGADIAVGEGQSMGIPRSFGGPGLGMFASRKKYVRNMPGRLVGQTLDADGRRGFVLTLSTREQHIRRERATSNICTNSGLCALMSAMYMSSMGKTGFTAISRLNFDKAEYLKKALEQAGGSPAFSGPTFNEFVMKMPEGFAAKRQALMKEKIVAGLPMAEYYPDMKNQYLFCATETRTKEEMDALAKEVRS